VNLGAIVFIGHASGVQREQKFHRAQRIGFRAVFKSDGTKYFADGVEIKKPLPIGNGFQMKLNFTF